MEEIKSGVYVRCSICRAELFCVSTHETGFFFGCSRCNRTFHETELRKKVRKKYLKLDEINERVKDENEIPEPD